MTKLKLYITDDLNYCVDVINGDTVILENMFKLIVDDYKKQLKVVFYNKLRKISDANVTYILREYMNGVFKNYDIFIED